LRGGEWHPQTHTPHQSETRGLSPKRTSGLAEKRNNEGKGPNENQETKNMAKVDSQEQNLSTESQCRVSGRRHRAQRMQTGGRIRLNLKSCTRTPRWPIHWQGVQYAERIQELDLNAVIKDLHALMTTRRKVAADFGHYGRCSIRWRGTAQVRTASATAARSGLRLPTFCAPQ